MSGPSWLLKAVKSHCSCRAHHRSPPECALIDRALTDRCAARGARSHLAAQWLDSCIKPPMLTCSLFLYAYLFRPQNSFLECRRSDCGYRNQSHHSTTPVLLQMRPYTHPSTQSKQEVNAYGLNATVRNFTSTMIDVHWKHILDIKNCRSSCQSKSSCPKCRFWGRKTEKRKIPKDFSNLEYSYSTYM